MKRIGNTWPGVLDVDNGIQAVIDGTKYKRGKRDVRFLLQEGAYHEIDRDKAKTYVEPIIRELKDKTWHHRPPRCKRQFCRNKTKQKGKWRDLSIPCLKDHIVAHMVMNANERAFLRGMHPGCCGSVPGRGIHYLVRNVAKWVRNDRQCRYFVKLDIRHFFDNIDRDELIRQLERKIKDRDSLWAFEQIIDSADSACPVGYYTSPWFANLYLERMDWHITQELFKERRGKRINYVRHYIRYMDDMLLIGTGKADLKKAVQDIRRFLGGIHLEIKQTWEIKAIGKHEDGKLKKGTYWIDIGGYQFCKDATIMRSGVYLTAKRLAKRIYKYGYSPHRCKAMISEIGWSEHCNNKTFLENDIKPYVNVKSVRRYISDVDKKRKRGSGEAKGNGSIRRPDYPAEEFPQKIGNGRNAGALGI